MIDSGNKYFKAYLMAINSVPVTELYSTAVNAYFSKCDDPEAIMDQSDMNELKEYIHFLETTLAAEYMRLKGYTVLNTDTVPRWGNKRVHASSGD